MIDPLLSYAMIAATAVMAVTIIAFVGLKAWREWIGLKREELGHSVGPDHMDGAALIGSRIEVAELRERVRKLEAIAAGVDL